MIVPFDDLELVYQSLRTLDTEHAARRLRLPGRVVRKWNTEGLGLIAQGLRTNRVRIF